MRVLERYSQAVNSGDLSVDERTTWSDTDILGAAGLAGRHNALGLALTRLFADGKAEPVVMVLSDLAFKRARTIRVKLGQTQAQDLARAVLGWHRFGTCQPCGGTGFQRVKDTPVLGNRCPHCEGMGKTPFAPLFDVELRELACWLSDAIGRAQAVAGSDAMRALAPTLDL